MQNHSKISPLTARPGLKKGNNKKQLHIVFCFSSVTLGSFLKINESKLALLYNAPVAFNYTGVEISTNKSDESPSTISADTPKKSH